MRDQIHRPTLPSYTQNTKSCTSSKRYSKTYFEPQQYRKGVGGVVFHSAITQSPAPTCQASARRAQKKSQTQLLELKKGNWACAKKMSCKQYSRTKWLE
jgi:hypothetical protein